MSSHYKRVIQDTFQLQAFGLGSLEQTLEPKRIASTKRAARFRTQLNGEVVVFSSEMR